MASRNLPRLIAGPSRTRIIISNGRQIARRTFADSPVEQSQPSSSEPRNLSPLQTPQRTNSSESDSGPTLLSSSHDNPLSQLPSSSTVSTERLEVSRPQMSELVANKKKTAIQYPYFVPRNSNGAVPVYSDFKNQRSRNLTLIRNVEGNVQVRSN
jgi:hypothetical protein